MRRLAFLLVAFALAACGPRPDPTPEATDLAPQDVARAYARAVLDRADGVEARRWSEASADLDVRSQVGFLQGERQVRYSPGRASKSRGVWEVTVQIESLRLGGSEYQGRMLLDLGPEGRRVRDAALLLERSDGAAFSL